MVLESFRVQEVGGLSRWLVLEQRPEPGTIGIVVESRMDGETQTQRLALSHDDWKDLIDRVRFFHTNFWAGDPNKTRIENDEEEPTA
jgi:hypothetical protein